MALGRLARPFLVALVLAACGAKPGSSSPAVSSPVSSAVTSAAPVASGTPPSGSPAKRAPVVVAIVVDQLSAWVAATRWPSLSEDGGFARLRREGTWVKNVRLPYAVTDTGPGHAALHTGKVPAESGIVGNEVPVGDRRISVLRDDATRAVTAEGPKDVAGASPARLRAETVADRLRAARPDALIVGLALKDRAAILPVGRHPTHAVWFDAGLDRFVTSTAFEPTLPKWVAPVAGPEAIARTRAVPWQPTDAAWIAGHAATPDDAPGEGDLDGLGTTFPHVARTPNAFRALPASDAMVLDLGLAAVTAEYDPTKPTLILLSMSASDVIGHTFGPDSWEAWDYLRKLDASLGAFLSALEKRTGPVTVMISADHGNVSMPEAKAARDALPSCKPGGAAVSPDPWDRPCHAGTRLGPKAIGEEIKTAVAKAMNRTDLVAGVSDPYVYLTPEGRALPEGPRATLDKVVRGVLDKHKDAVAEVYDVRALAAKCPAALASARGIPERALPGESVLTLVCRSWDGSFGAGDYYVVPKPASFWDGELVAGKGTSHGTPYLYDRTIPMLVRAPGEIDADEVVEAPVDFSAFAALEAHFVGLDSRPAKEILGGLTASPPRSTKTP